MMVSRGLAMAVIGLLAFSPAPAADNSHAFDPESGHWTIHVRRLMHPLAHRNDWVTYDGTKLVKPLWDGKANVAEVTADGKAGHLKFIALRLYDPASQQWSLYFTSANSGSFSTPLYGAVRGDAVEFVGPDTYNGRHILVRFVTHESAGDHATSEQYFSDDGGHSWELNWVNEYTRVKG